MKLRNFAACGALLVGAMILGGCGKSSYAADSSTVFVQKDGTVVTTDVEDFDESQYSTSELREYVQDAVAEYTSENGSKSLKFTNLDVSNDVARLTLTYASTEDYAAFNDTVLYTGTVVGALKDGFDYDVSFKQADGKEVSVSQVLDSEKLKIVIIRTGSSVQVPGKVVYYSFDADAVLEGKDTVLIGQSQLYEEETEAEAEEPVESAEGTEAIEGTEMVISGSVDDDELITGTEAEDTEVTFDFSAYEDGSTSDTDAQKDYASIYTYIVYK